MWDEKCSVHLFLSTTRYGLVCNHNQLTIIYIICNYIHTKLEMPAAVCWVDLKLMNMNDFAFRHSIDENASKRKWQNHVSFLTITQTRFTGCHWMVHLQNSTKLQVMETNQIQLQLVGAQTGHYITSVLRFVFCLEEADVTGGPRAWGGLADQKA